jgi:uncharacterized RmlC-like cupin family protein
VDDDGGTPERITRPIVVKPGDRRLARGPGTPGIDRTVAVEQDGVWFGMAQTQPGVLTAWHHHGDYDTYVYTLTGEARMDYLEGDDVVKTSTSPGDVWFIPKGVIHREGSASEEGAEAVVVRVGHGQVVFPLDDADLPPAAREA